jgi:hypothetical protein
MAGSSGLSVCLSLCPCFAVCRTSIADSIYKLLVFKHTSHFLPCFIDKKVMSKHKSMPKARFINLYLNLNTPTGIKTF